MIEFRAVIKRRSGFMLGPLDLKIEPGYVTGLVGANGAGKTTAIKILLGMVHADSGVVDRPEKADIGVVLDVPSYHPDWRAETVGKLMAPFYPKWSQTTFLTLLARFGVPGDRQVKKLSRGMCMKLQIAAAFAHEASFLVLDEPTSGLDPLSRDELAEIVGDFMIDERHSVLFSSHITSDIERVADYIAVLDQGHLVAYKEKSELLDAYRMVRGGFTAPGQDLERTAYGLRNHSAGWDALVPAAVLGKVPRDAVAEAPTLDDIVVRIAKGR